MNADTLLTGVDVVEVNFYVFVRAGKDEHVTYIGEGVAHGKPGSIMDLVKDKAKKMGFGSHSADYISGVYKVQSPNGRL